MNEESEIGESCLFGSAECALASEGFSNSAAGFLTSAKGFFASAAGFLASAAGFFASAAGFCLPQALRLFSVPVLDAGVVLAQVSHERGHQNQ